MKVKLLLLSSKEIKQLKKTGWKYKWLYRDNRNQIYAVEVDVLRD